MLRKFTTLMLKLVNIELGTGNFQGKIKIHYLEITLILPYCKAGWQVSSVQ
jgi:hypothetical protein